MGAASTSFRRDSRGLEITAHVVAQWMRFRAPSRMGDKVDADSGDTLQL
jgi:hypothetical protein